jgi:hypothetical protein
MPWALPAIAKHLTGVGYPSEDFSYPSEDFSAWIIALDSGAPRSGRDIEVARCLGRSVAAV